MLIKCKHLYGHFLGDPLLRIVRKPLKELRKISPGLIKSITRFGGASMSDRVGSIKDVLSLITRTGKDRDSEVYDPLYLLRKKLNGEIKEIEAIEKDVNDEMVSVVEEVLRIYMENNQE